jgi:prepilin-type N-terminal cleavage/methylation domain-containing protein
MRSTRRSTNRKGFTLIELLIVVVIIGILAAVAIPKFSNTKEKAFVASMKSDLKNLVSAQESYYADKSQYGDLAAVGTATTYGYTPSKGNTVLIANVSATGWTATVTNPSVSTTGTSTCGVKVGSTQPTGMPANTADGVPVCW